jgi:hypothetical protein
MRTNTSATRTHAIFFIFLLSLNTDHLLHIKGLIYQLCGVKYTTRPLRRGWTTCPSSCKFGTKVTIGPELRALLKEGSSRIASMHEPIVSIPWCPRHSSRCSRPLTLHRPTRPQSPTAWRTQIIQHRHRQGRQRQRRQSGWRAGATAANPPNPSCRRR